MELRPCPNCKGDRVRKEWIGTNWRYSICPGCHGSGDANAPGAPAAPPVEARRECWFTEDAKTGQLLQTSWKEPSDWITSNPKFRVSRWVEAQGNPGTGGGGSHE